MARYRIRVGRRIASAALVADGLHARADGFTSLAVLLGAAGVALGWREADPIIGLLITVAILGVLRSAVAQVGARLMDAVDPHLVDQATAAILTVPGVHAVRGLFSGSAPFPERRQTCHWLDDRHVAGADRSAWSRPRRWRRPSRACPAAGVLKLPTLAGPAGAHIHGQVLAGAAVAGVAAYLSVRFLTRYFTTRTLTPFAIYCLVAGVAGVAGVACIVRFA